MKNKVVCFLVFCRISNQSNVFKEIMRVLRPGLFINLYNPQKKKIY